MATTSYIVTTEIHLVEAMTAARLQSIADLKKLISQYQAQIDDPRTDAYDRVVLKRMITSFKEEIADLQASTE